MNAGKQRNKNEMSFVDVVLGIVIIIGILAVIALFYNHEDEEPNGYLNTTANFRSEVSLADKAIIKKYEAGTMVYILNDDAIDDTSNTGYKWRKVKIDDQVGYVVENYVDEFDFGRLGIDLSQWNKGVFSNSDKLTSFLKDRKIGFGFVRLGARTQGPSRLLIKDNMAKIYMDAFEAAKVPFGIYWFYEARNEEEALQEAKFIVECIKELDDYSYMKIPLFMDIEGKMMSMSEYVRLAKITIAEVKKQTKYDEIGFYIGASNCQKVYDQVTDYPLWVAHYDRSFRCLPNHYYNSNDYGLADAENLLVWQFTDDPNAFTRLGVGVDLDYASEKFVEAYLK